MSAIIQVEASYELRSRKSWVLEVRILEGIAAAGMNLEVPLNRSMVLTPVVLAVECVDQVATAESRIALVFDCEDEDALIWKDLPALGEVLVLS